PSFPVSRIELVLADTRAVAVLTDGTMTGRLPDTAVPVVDVDDPTISDEPGADPGTPIGEEHLAYVMYTSGSTGRPKGIAVTQANVLALAADRRWRGGGHDRVLVHSAHAFDASTYELWVPLLAGGQVVIAPLAELDTPTLRRLVSEHGI